MRSYRSRLPLMKPQTGMEWASLPIGNHKPVARFNREGQKRTHVCVLRQRLARSRMVNCLYVGIVRHFPVASARTACRSTLSAGISLCNRGQDSLVLACCWRRQQCLRRKSAACSHAQGRGTRGSRPGSGTSPRRLFPASSNCGRVVSTIPCAVTRRDSRDSSPV